MNEDGGSRHKTEARGGGANRSTEHAPRGQQGRCGHQGRFEGRVIGRLANGERKCPKADHMDPQDPHDGTVATHPDAVRQRPPTRQDRDESANGGEDRCARFGGMLVPPSPRTRCGAPSPTALFIGSLVLRRTFGATARTCSGASAETVSSARPIGYRPFVLEASPARSTHGVAFAELIPRGPSAGKSVNASAPPASGGSERSPPVPPPGQGPLRVDFRQPRTGGFKANETGGECTRRARAFPWVSPSARWQCSRARLAAQFGVPSPNRTNVLFVIIGIAALSRGGRVGLVVAVIAWFYQLLSLGLPGLPFAYTDEGRLRLVVTALAMPGVALVLGAFHDTLGRVRRSKRSSARRAKRWRWSSKPRRRQSSRRTSTAG